MYYFNVQIELIVGRLREARSQNTNLLVERAQGHLSFAVRKLSLRGSQQPTLLASLASDGVSVNINWLGEKGQLHNMTNGDLSRAFLADC